MKVVVLGSGVIGLTSAIRLQEAGHSVTIWSETFPPHTTSNVAAAIWYPYKAYPEDKVQTWALDTLYEFRKLTSITGTGVRLANGKKYFHRPMGNPWWAKAMPDFRRVGRAELGEGQVAGYAFSVPVADMSRYLTLYLPERFTSAGGKMVKRKVMNFEDPLTSFPIVVNCTGLGSAALARDPRLFPIRGQVVAVEKPASVREFILDTDNPRGMIYVIPRETECILGGVSQKGDWSLEVDVAEGAAIVERCTSLVGELENAKILEHRVGLRPGRDAVRLEAQRMSGGTVIHNYGHGGSGMTLSWGCANEVLKITARLETSERPS